MADNSTWVLILAQLLVVAVIAASMLALLLWRVRQRHRQLLSLYASLKHQEQSQADAEQAANPDDGTGLVERIDWSNLESEALQRYQEFSGKSLGDYAIDDPFSARIASIRYHYLQAERLAEPHPTVHERWQSLEKALAKLVSTIVSSAKPLPSHDPDKLSLLRERMKTLKNIEQDNADLRGKNQRYGAEIKKLRGYYKKYRELMAQAGAPKVAEDAEAQGRIKTRNMVAANEQQRQLVDGMHSHINDADNKAVYQEQPAVHGQIEQLQEGVQAYDETLKQLQQSQQQNAELDKLAVIDSLRGNSYRQRNTIVNLYRDLSDLQATLNDDSQDKKSQMQALQRLLSECENCIATLESEVEYLHKLLQDVPEPQSLAPTAEPVPDDTLAETLLAFSLSIVEKHSLDEVLQLVADTLVQINLPYVAAVSFAGETVLGGSTNLDNKTQHQRLLDIADVSLQENNAEGLFFSRPCLQVFVPKAALADINLQELIRLLGVMHALIMLQLEQYAALQRLTEHHLEVVRVGQQIRTGVTNIDIQYAFQSEESRRIATSLLQELNELLLAVDADDDMREMFAHAMAEAQLKFTTLYKERSVLDHEFSSLSETIDKLEQP